MPSLDFQSLQTEFGIDSLSVRGKIYCDSADFSGYGFVDSSLPSGYSAYIVPAGCRDITGVDTVTSPGYTSLTITVDFGPSVNSTPTSSSSSPSTPTLPMKAPSIPVGVVTFATKPILPKGSKVPVLDKAASIAAPVINTNIVDASGHHIYVSKVQQPTYVWKIDTKVIKKATKNVITLSKSILGASLYRSAHGKKLSVTINITSKGVYATLTKTISLGIIK